MKPYEIEVGKVYKGGPYAHPRRVTSIEDGVVEFELLVHNPNRWRTPVTVGHESHRKQLKKNGKLTNKLQSFANWAKAVVE